MSSREALLSHVTSTFWFLKVLDIPSCWTKTMAFKPSKCRSWAGRFFRNGEKTKFSKLQNSTYSFYDPLLTVNGDAILCVGQDTKSDFMFKILGRQLQWELTNDKIIEKLDTLIEEWLHKMNTISLYGCIKSGIVDNVVVSCFSWPLSWFPTVCSTSTKLVK